MRIPAQNIKLVKELTKYISPSEIEKARFKRFNAQKIDDGNIVCDEFFRTNELFDRKIDEIKTAQQYGIDDLPIYTESKLLSNDIRRISNSKAGNAENDLPYYVDIIGEKNKRIYVEEYGTKNPKHPHFEPYNTEHVWYADRKLYENRTIDEVVNIRYHATELSAVGSRSLEHEALRLMQKGYPLEYVIYIMKQSVLKSPYGRSEAYTPLMKFLSEHPDMRRYVVTHNCFKEEIFDSCAAKMLPKLLETCNNDMKVVNQILWDCRIQTHNEVFLTEPNILKTAINLYKIDNVWNEQKTKIIEELAAKKKTVLADYSKRIEFMICEKCSLDFILDKITQKINKKS